MIKSNYHIHSTFCDGHASLEEMAQAAYNAGLTSIGFSSHFVLDYNDDYAISRKDIQDYFSQIDALKKKYQGKMDIYRSFEMDYYMHYNDISEFAKKIRPKLDYIIGSIHTIGFLPNNEMSVIDDTEESFKNGVSKLYKSPELFVKDYYKKIGDMAENLQPDIIGHIDLIKKNNFGVYDENAQYYKKAALEALDRIAQTPCIIEINTGGIYRYGERCLYPSEFLIKEIRKRDIPITVNGDTHFSDGINFYYDRIERLLKDNKFESIMQKTPEGWKSVSF